MSIKNRVLILDAIGANVGIKEIDNVREVLGASAQTFSFQDHDIQIAAITEEAVLAADKIIISGSPFSVYDEQLWMKHLDQALTLALKYQKSTLAVCFGAQFVAQFLGVKVTKNPAGTEFGSIKISLTDRGAEHPILAGFHQSQYVHGSHNDYIPSLPSGAVHLAYNDHSPIQAFQYGSILAPQFHPDLPVAVLRQLLANRKERYLASGFLKDEQHYDQIHTDLVYGTTGHAILLRFLES